MVAKALIGDYTGSAAKFGPANAVNAVSVSAGGDAAVNVQVNDQVAKSLATCGNYRCAANHSAVVVRIRQCGCFASAISYRWCLHILATFAELFILGSITNVSVYSISLTTQLGPWIRYRLCAADGQPVP